MRISVLKENYTIKDEYSKIAEFYDAFHAGIFLNQLMDDAYQDGKITLKVVIDFPDCVKCELYEERMKDGDQS